MHVQAAVAEAVMLVNAGSKRTSEVILKILCLHTSARATKKVTEKDKHQEYVFLEMWIIQTAGVFPANACVCRWRGTPINSSTPWLALLNSHPVPAVDRVEVCLEQQAIVQVAVIKALLNGQCCPQSFDACAEANVKGIGGH